MRLLITILSFLIWTKAQSQCQQFTHTSCPGNTCFVINDTTLDIKSSTATYINVNGDCFTYDNTAGISAGFMEDDKYSASITIPNFPYFGNIYNRIYASPNGVISFDINNIIAGMFAHFGIFDDAAGGLSPYGGTPVNLPSTLYDRAIIMALYHDLNIAANTSPAKRVDYRIVGGKVIISWYAMPLYSPLTNGCELLINNTHQLILHPSGLIEVRIKDKEICTLWNEGRSIIGIQNYNRNLAYTAKPATVWDASNETQYFVPNSGASTFINATLLPIGLQGIPTYLNDGRIAIRYELCNQPFGQTQYISRVTYSSGVMDDTITVNKVAADPLQCVALPIRDNRIVYTPIRSIVWKQIKIYNVLGQFLSEHKGRWEDSLLDKYPSGTYIVVTLDRNDKLYSYKKVK